VKLILNPKLRPYFSSKTNIFDQIMQLHGQVFRQLEGRKTQRIILGENSYFLKQHFGIGWKEIFKNLFQLRLPVLGAKNEWLAIQKLEKLHIPTLKVEGYGCRGINPASRQSFLLTQELESFISLEDYCKDWLKQPPHFIVKQRLIKAVAQIAKAMHESGMNHRDFYICHFLMAENSLPEKLKLYLIDLHRAQIRYKTPKRWLIKDLSGLYFSCKEIGLSSRDLLRFIAEYKNQPWRKVLNREKHFWQKVRQRGDKMYRKHGK
jgi:heptose I phosphotransferase